MEPNLWTAHQITTPLSACFEPVRARGRGKDLVVLVDSSMKGGTQFAVAVHAVVQLDGKAISGVLWAGLATTSGKGCGGTRKGAKEMLQHWGLFI